MKLRVAGVKDHQTHKNHHIGQPVQRRIEKTAESRHAARETSHLAVQHVKQISDNEGDSGREKAAHPKKKTATDVQSDTDDGQNIWVDVTVGQPAYHRVNNSLSCPSDTGTKHVLGSFLLVYTIVATDYTDIYVMCGQKLLICFQFVV